MDVGIASKFTSLTTLINFLILIQFNTFKKHILIDVALICIDVIYDLPCDLPCAASLAGIQPVRPRAQRTSP